MLQAYYRPSVVVEDKPKTIVPLPTRSDTLTFTSGLFSSQTCKYDVVPSDELSRASSVKICIGQSYDGLPLVLKVCRERNIKTRILSELGVTSESDLHESIRQPLSDLEKAVELRSLKTGIVETDSLGTKAQSYYKTNSDVGCLIKTTIFANLLGDSSESSLNERGEGYEEASLDKKTTMHVGIPLGGTADSSKPLSVKTHPDQSGKLGNGDVILEPLYLESLTGVLSSTKFRCTPTDDYSGKVYEGLLSDRISYLHAISISRSIEFLIEPNELIEKVVIPLCQDAHKTMHLKGKVHGDIKPANILFVQGGPKLIDARGCKSGGISSTYTPPWCPPEQILGKPIEPSADVYALAMLCAKIIGAELYGEIKNFKMPSTSSPIQVLDAEGVWIETSAGLTEETRSAWRNGLTKFLAFDSVKRPKNGEDLANELIALIKAHPLTGLKPLQLKNAGTGNARLQTVKLESLKKHGVIEEKESDLTDLVDKVYPCWVLNDTYSTLS